MSRRCITKPLASARDLFIRDLFIGGNLRKIQLLFIGRTFVKDSATLGEFENEVLFSN